MKARDPKSMDTDILGAFHSASLTGGKFSLGELGLGAFTPSKARKVANINSFKFDKDLGNISQQNTRRSSIFKIAPLLVTIDK
jgi:hypothetical protein